MIEGPLLLLIIALGVAFIVLSTSWLKLHPFLALLLATIGVGAAVGMPFDKVVTAINTGFGNLMGYIGLVVVLGSIIGVQLEKSGAALRLADLVIKAVGAGKPVLAMSVIGLIVGIPVFCDSGFIILSGISKALGRRTGARQGALNLALASGLYTSHTLVPPTPGPIAAAGNLGAAPYLGTVILLGLVVAVPVVLVAYFYARWAGWHIEQPVSEVAADHPETDQLPGAGKSLAPIVVPIFLIALASFVPLLALPAELVRIVILLGQPLIALLIGALLGFRLFPKWETKYVTGWLSEGIQQAGPILILTGAGGAFGAVLKATPVANLVSSWVTTGQASGSMLLVISFIIAALLKTSQGSTTSALVITSSMLAPLLPAMAFDTPIQLSLLVLAIGGGAMVVSHTNDSYFWVVNQFSGMSVREAYRGFTLITLVQGLTTLAVTCLLYFLFV